MHFMNGPSPYTGASTAGSHFPSILPLSEATDWLEQCAEGEVLLGVDGSGRPVKVDLDSESPHILVNAMTGAGKSGIARSVGVQRAQRGDLVVFLDRKMHSHRWARPLAPLCFYADHVESIASSLYNLGQELNRRNRVVRDFPGPVEDAPVGPRIMIMFEEMNATLAQLKELDRQLKSSYGALDALRDLLFMGRAVRMHVIGFAQLASYRSGLSQDMLENFGTKIMIDYSPQAWRYLASECGPHRTAPPEVGRGMVCQRGRAVETQLLWVTEEVAGPAVTSSLPAQRRARELSGGVRGLSPVWRTAIGR